MPYNPDIHHRRSIRLKEYDYSQAGAYYVTLCTYQRECLFGEIIDGEMRLNDWGRIIYDSWEWLGQQYAYVDLYEWVIMPNHFHGIIVIDDRRGGSRTALTQKPLGRLVGAFKTVSSKQINKLRDNPGCPVWQRNYYEHVIRNDDDLNRIREYIINNPMQWELDENNPTNISVVGAVRELPLRDSGKADEERKFMKGVVQGLTDLEEGGR